MTMLFKMIQADIDGATTLGGCDCPVARTIKRRFPNYYVRVGPRHTAVEGDVYDLPIRVKRFVDKFDRDGEKAVSPINFRLPIEE